MGQATIDAVPAVEGDWSAAFTQDGICAGAAILMINDGIAYINMQIYGDDSTTPDVDEGMNVGESFTLKVWDSSARMLFLNIQRVLTAGTIIMVLPWVVVVAILKSIIFLFRP
jgi:hypothetical protein